MVHSYNIHCMYSNMLSENDGMVRIQIAKNIEVESKKR